MKINNKGSWPMNNDFTMKIDDLGGESIWVPVRLR